MKHFLIYVALLLPFWLSAQDIKEITTKELAPPPVMLSSMPFSFRLTNNSGQRLDISISADAKKTGILTNHIRAYRSEEDHKGIQEDTPAYLQVIPLTDAEVDTVLAIIYYYDGFSWRDDDIDNWQHGMSGKYFMVERNENGKFDQMTYDVPSKQNKLFASFYSEIENILSLTRRYNEFTAVLPAGDYNVDNGVILRIRHKHWWKFWM